MMKIMKHLPSWIKINKYDKKKYLNTKEIIERYNLNTVCIEADCPNRYECFSNGSATFLIMGDICTRDCRYCNVKKGKPKRLDKTEPIKVSEAVKKLGLNYVVITCTTRDDLKDFGANHFAETVRCIKKINTECKIELLISDLKGDWECLKIILSSKPDLINHNLETTENLFNKLRPKGNYNLSLKLLKEAKEIDPIMKTKSGLMVGLGEEIEDIIQTIKDLKNAKCDIITIGQYLQPIRNNYNTKKYYSPEEFNEIKIIAEKIGIKKVISGPMIRSSYRAMEIS